MVTRARLVALLLALVALPGSLSAQVVGPLSDARIRGILRRSLPPLVNLPPPPATTGTVNCDPYVLVSPDKSRPRTASQLKDVATCLNDVDRALVDLAKQPSSATVNQDVIKARINYKRLKKWIPDAPLLANGAPISQWLDAKKAENAVDAQLPRALKAHDLFATFAAVLVTGATLFDAAQPEPEADDAPATTEDAAAPEGEAATAALGTIVWQSRHFGDESLENFDLSIGGRIGVQPMLNLVTTTPAEDAAEGATSTVSAVHQNAFLWTFGVQGHRQFRGINSELGMYGSTGSSTLASLPKAVDQGQGSFLAFPLDYGAQKTRWLWEAGLTFNIFDNRLEQIHAEKGTTTPQFQALIAVRRDERFTGGAFDRYENPSGRLLFRMTLDAIRVFDRRQFGEPTQPFTFGFVVEHERSLVSSGLRVPSATRFVLRGDVNLLRALNGQAPADTSDETPEATTYAWTVTPPETATLQVSKEATSVAIALRSLTVGSKTETPTLAPVTVALGKADGIAIPGCPGATVQFALKAGELTATPMGWAACTGSMQLTVTEPQKE